MLPGDVVASIYGSLWIYPCIYTTRFGDFGGAAGVILWVLLYLRGEMVCHRCSIAALATLAELVFGIFEGRDAHFVGKIIFTQLVLGILFFGGGAGAILWVLLYLRGKTVCHRCSIAALAPLTQLVLGILGGRNTHFVG
jgi:hypothetical protein